MDRAGAALAVRAALLGAGEADVVAQRVEQGRARVEAQRMRVLVHAHGHRLRLAWPALRRLCGGFCGAERPGEGNGGTGRDGSPEEVAPA